MRLILLLTFSESTYASTPGLDPFSGYILYIALPLTIIAFIAEYFRRKYAVSAWFVFSNIVLFFISSIFLWISVAPKQPYPRQIRAKTHIRAIEIALEEYNQDNNGFPSEEQGLLALVQKPLVPPIPKNWRDSGYMVYLPKDPWGGTYFYKYPGSSGVFEIYSLGSDNLPGGSGTKEDLSLIHI